MNRTKIAFVAVTSILALGMLPGAVMNLTQPEMVVEMMAKLGLPLHLLTLMGVWKFLGIIALANPRFPRINEWAYAGFFFDLSGAAYLHAAAGDFAGTPPSIFLVGLLVASYRLRDKVRGLEQSPNHENSGVALPVSA